MIVSEAELLEPLLQRCWRAEEKNGPASRPGANSTPPDCVGSSDHQTSIGMSSRCDVRLKLPPLPSPKAVIEYVEDEVELKTHMDWLSAESPLSDKDPSCTSASPDILTFPDPLPCASAAVVTGGDDDPRMRQISSLFVTLTIAAICKIMVNKK